MIQFPEAGHEVLAGLPQGLLYLLAVLLAPHELRVQVLTASAVHVSDRAPRAGHEDRALEPLHG
jgi:hypothetical protein